MYACKHSIISVIQIEKEMLKLMKRIPKNVGFFSLEHPFSCSERVEKGANGSRSEAKKLKIICIEKCKQSVQKWKLIFFSFFFSVFLCHESMEMFPIFKDQWLI